MSSFIEQSILSIANQLDNKYEIVVVDGGSTDGSVEILKRLSSWLPNVRPFFLCRGPRTLGEERNFSIRMARGKYVLLHLDCDDLYYPFIKDWVSIFHAIEKVYGDSGILVSGCHINMGRRDFLLQNGPYRHLVFEDRELWNRLNQTGEFVRLEHRNFVIRSPLTLVQKAKKIPKKIFVEMKENLEQFHGSKLDYFFRELSLVRYRSILHFTLRLLILPVSCFFARRPLRQVNKITNTELLPLRTISLDELLVKYPDVIAIESLTKASLPFFLRCRRNS